MIYNVGRGGNSLTTRSGFTHQKRSSMGLAIHPLYLNGIETPHGCEARAIAQDAGRVLQRIARYDRFCFFASSFCFYYVHLLLFPGRTNFHRSISSLWRSSPVFFFFIFFFSTLLSPYRLILLFVLFGCDMEQAKQSWHGIVRLS
ncbi:hypothetical protein F4802DRAFT_271687 [Xylaria palmicola]|nr:hypothetical protein F4802DRAFT_271687 [Xylaria palmicola]